MFDFQRHVRQSMRTGVPYRNAVAMAEAEEKRVGYTIHTADGLHSWATTADGAHRMVDRMREGRADATATEEMKP